MIPAGTATIPSPHINTTNVKTSTARGDWIHIPIANGRQCRDCPPEAVEYGCKLLRLRLVLESNRCPQLKYRER